MTEQASIVYIVDDDSAVCDALKRLLTSVKIDTRRFASCDDFLDALEANLPGCVVLDIRMPGRSGLEIQEWLADHAPELPIIFLSGHADVPMAVRAMKSGAFDFFEKPFRNQDLIDSVQGAIARGSELTRRRREAEGTRRRLETLTARQRQVLDLMLADKSNREIATELGISERTAEAHRQKVLHNMGARTPLGLMKAIAAAGEPLGNP